MAEGALIVADTGPLIALAHVEQVELLKDFYAQVLLTPTIAEELRASRHEAVHDLLRRHPWLQVVAPTALPDATLVAALDPGEASAISLAVERGAALLIDERRGRRIAQELYGLEVHGSLGVLVRARRENRIPKLAPLLQLMIARGDHLTTELIQTVLSLAGEVES